MARLSDIRLRRSAVSGSIPSTSNLNLGELALNTYDGKLYMKKNVGGTESVVEVGAGGGGIAASFTAYEFTASANQTSFSGSDNYSNTLAYNTGTPPKVQVFMNGILLDEGSSADYTGTNGTAIVLTSGADVNDLVQIHAYKSDVSVVSNISLADNQKVTFGTGNDLQIYHDGSNSYIKDVGTGNLNIQTNGVGVVISDTSASDLAVFNAGNGIVTLYKSGSPKLATASTGIDVTGNITVSGTVDGIDIAARDAVLTSTTTTAGAALPKTGGAMTGNLLVGTTSTSIKTDNSNAGHNFFTNGETVHARSGNTVMSLNRQTDDGTILDFRKAGTTIGVLASRSGDLVIRTGDTGITFNDAVDAIIPHGATNIVDNQIDLGYSSHRFKDLRLAGTANVGSVTSTGQINAGTNLVATTSVYSGNGVYYGSSTLSLKNSSSVSFLDFASNGNASFSGAVNATEVRVGNLVNNGTISANAVSGKQALTAKVQNNGNSIFQGFNASDALITQITGAGALTHNGTATFSGDVSVPNISVADDIRHSGDSDTYLSFEANYLGMYTNGKNTLVLNDGNVNIPSGSLMVGSTAVASSKFELNSAGANSVYQTFTRSTGGTNEKYWQMGIGTNHRFSIGRQVDANNSLSEYLSIASSGNVGIGATSPGGPLHVKSAANKTIIADATLSSGSITSFAFQRNSADKWRIIQQANDSHLSFYNDQTSAYQLSLKNDGNVGIGNNNPSTKLQVAGIVQINESGDTAFYEGQGVRLFGTQNYRFRNTGGNTRAVIDVNGSGNTAGNLTLYNASNAIKSYINNAGNSYFNGGNVGIGDDSPSFKLTVGKQNQSLGSITTNKQVLIGLDGGYSTNDSLQYKMIGFTGTTVSTADIYSSTFASGEFLKNFFAGLTSPNSYFNNSRYSIVQGGQDRLVIRQGGNVGIGTSSPTHKLHVAGDIRINNGSALKLYNAAGNGWAQIAYNNSLDHIEIQRSFQSASDSVYNLGSSSKKWLAVYSDRILAANGTPAAPAYTFDSDQNTGMYTSAGDTLNFTTGGVQRMSLNSAGITSAANVYTASGYEFRNYGGTWKATTGTAAGDFEFRGNTGGTNQGLMYMDTSTGRVAVGNGFNSTNVKSELQIYHAGIDTYAVTTSATSAAQVDTFSAGDFRSARFTVQITNTTDSTYQITEILLIHDGTTPSMTEYSTIFTGSAREASFDADIVGGNVRLLATPASTDTMQFKVVRHSILV